MLSRPDCTLEALLQEDELLQELKALNNRVIDLCVPQARSAGHRNAGLGPAPDRNAGPQRPQRLRHCCLPASPRLVASRVVTHTLSAVSGLTRACVAPPAQPASERQRREAGQARASFCTLALPAWCHVPRGAAAGLQPGCRGRKCGLKDPLWGHIPCAWPLIPPSPQRPRPVPRLTVSLPCLCFLLLGPGTSSSRLSRQNSAQSLPSCVEGGLRPLTYALSLPLPFPHHSARLAFLACEIFSFELEALFSTLLLEAGGNLFGLLFSLLDAPPPLNSVQAGYFSRVACAILGRRAIPALQLLHSRPRCLERLLVHVDNTSCCEVLLRLVGADDGPLANHPDAQAWLCASPLLGRLLDALGPESSPNAQAGAASVLCAIARTAPSELASSMAAPPALGRLFSQGLLCGPGAGGKGLSHTLDVAMALLDPRPPRVSAPALAAFYDSAKREGAVEPSRMAGAALPHFSSLVARLSWGGDARQQATSWGNLRPPLGFDRLKCVEFLGVMLRTGSPPVREAYCRLNVVCHCLDLLAAYPVNSMLHIAVDGQLSYCLGMLPATTWPAADNSGRGSNTGGWGDDGGQQRKEAPLDVVLLRHVVTAPVDLPARLVGIPLTVAPEGSAVAPPTPQLGARRTSASGGQRPSESTAGRTPWRAGHCGLLARCANRLNELAGTNSYPWLNAALSSNSAWSNSGWSSFVRSCNDADNGGQWACGRPVRGMSGRPSSAVGDDDDVGDVSGSYGGGGHLGGEDGVEEEDALAEEHIHSLHGASHRGWNVAGDADFGDGDAFGDASSGLHSLDTTAAVLKLSRDVYHRYDGFDGSAEDNSFGGGQGHGGGLQTQAHRGGGDSDSEDSDDSSDDDGGNKHHRREGITGAAAWRSAHDDASSDEGASSDEDGGHAAGGETVVVGASWATKSDGSGIDLGSLTFLTGGNDSAPQAAPSAGQQPHSGAPPSPGAGATTAALLSPPSSPGSPGFTAGVAGLVGDDEDPAPAPDSLGDDDEVQFAGPRDEVDLGGGATTATLAAGQHISLGLLTGSTGAALQYDATSFWKLGYDAQLTPDDV